MCARAARSGRLEIEKNPLSNNVLKSTITNSAEDSIAAPSVVTMNAIACAHAADDFLFHMTGLKYDTAETGWFRWNSRKGTAGYDNPRKDLQCLECSDSPESRLGRGDDHPLPVRSKRG